MPETIRQIAEQEEADSLGARLRARRKALGLTMQKVAEEAGLTIGFISQIERGLASPSLSSLAAVSRVLDLDTSELFAQPPSPGAVTTAGLRPVYGIDPANMTYERISSSFPGNVLRAVLIHEAPGHRSEPIRHEGEELFYILHGALTVEIEGQRQVLKPGDSIHFASNRVHSSWNHTDQPTTILHVCTMDVFGDGARSEHLTTTKDNQRG
ncbi:MAG: helix-turn-helix domain-containing protein [Paracoccaceae bacterium]